MVLDRNGLDSEGRLRMERLRYEQENEYESELDEERSAAARREDVRKRYSTGLWKTLDGRVVNVHTSMTPAHAENVLAMLEKRKARDAAVLGFYGKPADTWFGTTTLVEALRKTAARRPTIKELWRDRQSLKRWKAAQQEAQVTREKFATSLRESYVPTIRRQLEEDNIILRLLNEPPE